MIARLLAVAIVGLLPAAAAAHSGHGDVSPQGSQGLVTVEGYQVEILSHPSPLTPGQANHVVAKIVTASTLEPVSAGRVLIGLARVGTDPEMASAPENMGAGSYTATFTPERAGPHQARVVVMELGGRHFDPPLTLAFPMVVQRAPGLGAAVWALLVALGLGTAVVLYTMGLRARAGRLPGQPTNWLEVPWFRRLLTAPAFQPALQVPLLVVMGIVVFLGFHDVQDGGMNLATKLTWTIWWAGIIFTFVLAGRVWCLACPFGALNEWAARLAIPGRRLPRLFRNLWWATAMFVVLTWADEQLGVVRSPAVTASIVLFFAVLAVGIGLFFERRSFCRYLCPIGGVIGLYAMTAPVELRAGDPGTCRAHSAKTCYLGGAGAPGCPMFEFPQSMDRNTYCTFCAACVRSCAHDNLVLRLRSFGRDLWASGRRTLDEAYLAIALAGLTVLVTAQMLTIWPEWIASLADWLPDIVRSRLEPVSDLALVESVVLLGGALIAAPAALLAAAALGDRLAGARGLGVRRTFVVFGYVLIPVALGIHLAHNLDHLLLEGAGIVPAVQRAIGLYTPWSLGQADWTPAPLAPVAVVALLQIAVIVAFFVLSVVAAHRLATRVYDDAGVASRAIVPVAVLSWIFTVAGIVLLQLPMGMRHGM
jgi:polyferredoxin